MSTRKKNNGWDKDYEEKRNRNNEAQILYYRTKIFSVRGHP